MKPGETFHPFKLFVGLFVPNALARFPGITPGAKLLYGRLAQYGGKDGLCYPSQELLAEEIGVTDRQVRRLLGELCEGKFIKVVRAEGRDRLNHKTNRYAFLWHTIFCLSGEDVDVRSAEDVNVRSYKGVVRDSVVRESKEHSACEKVEYQPTNPEPSKEPGQSDMTALSDHSWQQFKTIMPRRNGKFIDEDACREKWTRTPAMWNQWISAARNYATSAEVRDGAICGPMKFLKQKWSDWQESETLSGAGSSARAPDLSWMKNLKEDEKIIEQERQAGPKERLKPSWAQQTTT